MRNLPPILVHLAIGFLGAIFGVSVSLLAARRWIRRETVASAATKDLGRHDAQPTEAAAEEKARHLRWHQQAIERHNREGVDLSWGPEAIS
jgi:LPS O-antigen subunit length determinant protein (WzzB/FepE family)